MTFVTMCVMLSATLFVVLRNVIIRWLRIFGCIYCTMMCYRFAESFQIGYNNNVKKCTDLCASRAQSLTLSAHRKMSKWHAATHCMDLEQTEFR